MSPGEAPGAGRRPPTRINEGNPWGPPSDTSAPEPVGAPPPGWPTTPLGQPWPSQPYGQPGWPAYQPAWGAPQRTNPWSVVALVTGILPLFPVAIGAGIAGVVQTGRRHERGRGMAIAGLLLGCLWTGVVAVGVIGALAAGVLANRIGAEFRQDLGPVRDAGSTTVGSCLQRHGARAPSTAVSCSEAHDAEVFYVYELEEGDFPGPENAPAADGPDCRMMYEGYVGGAAAYEDTFYAWYQPDEAEWSSGERRVVCVVVPPPFGELPRRSVRSTGG